MRRLASVAFALVLLGSVMGPALAQDAHSMPGEVTRVDQKDGWVHVKTSEGTLIVHFPPADLKNVKKGDKITLHLALKDLGPAAPSTTEKTPPTKK